MKKLPPKQPVQCCLCSPTPTHQEHLELNEDKKQAKKADALISTESFHY